MSDQLIEINKVETAWTINKTGLLTMWISFTFFALADSGIFNAIGNLLCTVVFCVVGFSFKEALETNKITERIAVQPSHSGRRIIYTSTSIIAFTCFAWLATSISTASAAIHAFTICAFTLMLGCTLLRFVGLQKQ